MRERLRRSVDFVRNFDYRNADDWKQVGAVVGVVSLVILLAILGYDLATSVEKRCWGAVSSKEYVPAHTHHRIYTTTDGNGHTQVRTSAEHHPDRWYVYATLDDGDEVTIEAEQDLYEALSSNDRLIIKYMSGRLIPRWGVEIVGYEKGRGLPSEKNF